MSEPLLHSLKEAGSFFIFAFLELTLLFLVVSFFVEIINVFLNPTKVQKVLSSSKGGYFTASSLGALTPFCSCSSIPLTLGLIKAKASFGPIMTFLFTSPLLNPIVIAVFWSAFGVEVTLVYAFIALVVSVLAGVLLEYFGFERFIKKELFESSLTPRHQTKKLKLGSFSTAKGNFSTACCAPAPSKKEQLFNKTLFMKTYKQFISFAPYLALGIGIGAFVHGFVPQEFLTKYAGEQNPFAVFIAAFIGIPLYIRASSMVGIAPALLDGGVSMGAILALTVAGAGASLPEMIMLKKIFKAPIMLFFLLSVFSMAIGCGFLVNLYFT